MTLLQLRYIVSLCEKGSTLAAAEDMHISQSTISLSLKKLEEELMVPLFKRTPRGLEPTEAGLLLKKHADCILSHVRQAERELYDMANIDQTLTIGLAYMVCVSLWPHLYAFAQSEHFPSNLETITESRSTSLLLLDQGKIDCYITTLRDPEQQGAGYHLHFIANASPLVFCISKNNPLTHKLSVTYSELFSTPLVRLKETGHSYIDRLIQSYNCTPNYIQTCDQISTMIQLIANNVAGGFLNAHLLEGYHGIKTYELKDIKSAGYYLVYTDRIKKAKNFRLFLNMLKRFSQSISTSPL